MELNSDNNMLTSIVVYRNYELLFIGIRMECKLVIILWMALCLPNVSVEMKHA